MGQGAMKHPSAEQMATYEGVNSRQIRHTQELVKEKVMKVDPNGTIRVLASISRKLNQQLIAVNQTILFYFSRENRSEYAFDPNWVREEIKKEGLRVYGENSMKDRAEIEIKSRFHWAIAVMHIGFGEDLWFELRKSKAEAEKRGGIGFRPNRPRFSNELTLLARSGLIDYVEFQRAPTGHTGSEKQKRFVVFRTLPVAREMMEMHVAKVLAPPPGGVSFFFGTNDSFDDINSYFGKNVTPILAQMAPPFRLFNDVEKEMTSTGLTGLQTEAYIAMVWHCCFWGLRSPYGKAVRSITGKKGTGAHKRGKNGRFCGVKGEKKGDEDDDDTDSEVEKDTTRIGSQSAVYPSGALVADSDTMVDARQEAHSKQAQEEKLFTLHSGKKSRPKFVLPDAVSAKLSADLLARIEKTNALMEEYLAGDSAEEMSKVEGISLVMERDDDPRMTLLPDTKGTYAIGPLTHGIGEEIWFAMHPNESALEKNERVIDGKSTLDQDQFHFQAWALRDSGLVRFTPEAENDNVDLDGDSDPDDLLDEKMPRPVVQLEDFSTSFMLRKRASDLLARTRSPAEDQKAKNAFASANVYMPRDLSALIARYISKTPSSPYFAFGRIDAKIANGTLPEAQARAYMAFLWRAAFPTLTDPFSAKAINITGVAHKRDTNGQFCGVKGENKVRAETGSESETEAEIIKAGKSKVVNNGKIAREDVFSLYPNANGMFLRQDAHYHKGYGKVFIVKEVGKAPQFVVYDKYLPSLSSELKERIVRTNQLAAEYAKGDSAEDRKRVQTYIAKVQSEVKSESPELQSETIKEAKLLVPWCNAKGTNSDKMFKAIGEEVWFILFPEEAAKEKRARTEKLTAKPAYTAEFKFVGTPTVWLDQCLYQLVMLHGPFVERNPGFASLAERPSFQVDGFRTSLALRKKTVQMLIESGVFGAAEQTQTAKSVAAITSIIPDIAEIVSEFLPNKAPEFPFLELGRIDAKIASGTLGEDKTRAYISLLWHAAFPTLTDPFSAAAVKVTGTVHKRGRSGRFCGGKGKICSALGCETCRLWVTEDAATGKMEPVEYVDRVLTPADLKCIEGLNAEIVALKRTDSAYDAKLKSRQCEICCIVEYTLNAKGFDKINAPGMADLKRFVNPKGARESSYVLATNLFASLTAEQKEEFKTVNLPDAAIKKQYVLHAAATKDIRKCTLLMLLSFATINKFDLKQAPKWEARTKTGKKGKGKARK